MGILTVVEQVSSTYKPSQNDNIFVVTAPTGVTSQNNVKILADVKDGSGNLLARLKAPIYYGTTNKAVFNISQILCDYVITDWDFNDTESKDCQTQRFGYQVAFGYEYSTGTTSPIVPVSGDTTISSRSVFNAVLDPFEWLDYDQADYLMASGSTANFLTNNFNKRIHIDQKEWLYALHGSSIGYLSVNWSDSVRNLFYNSVLEGVSPTFWSVIGTGTSTPTASTIDSYSTAYINTVTSGKQILQVANSITLTANTSYVFSIDLEQVSGTINYNDILTIAAVPIGCTFTYYRNGILVNENSQAQTGRLALVLGVGATAGIGFPRFGVGTSTENATATALVSRPQFTIGATLNNYVPTKLISAKSGTICRFPIGSNIPDGIPLGIDGYIVTPIQTGGALVGTPYTIDIDDRCSKYPSIDLFFVNRLGAVESFRFDMIHTKTHNVERKTYRKNPYSLNVNTYNYSKQGHTLSNYLNETRERLVLNSNFITEEEAEWLQELVSSPKVWMYDGQIKGVTIVTNTYEEKQHVKDKVFNLTLEVEVSYYDTRR